MLLWASLQNISRVLSTALVAFLSVAAKATMGYPF